MIRKKTTFAPATLALAILLGGSVDTLAQPSEQRGRPQSDAMVIQFEVFPSALVSSPIPGSFEEVLETSIHTGKLELNFPLVLAPPRTVVLGAIQYRFLQFDHKNWISDNAPYVPGEFHSLGIRLTLRHLLNRQTALSAHVKPALASDLQNIEGNHVNVTGGFFLSRRFSPSLQLGLGAAYLNDFGEPLILPLVQVTWTPPDKNYMVVALLPRNATLWYQYRPTVRLGVAAKMEGEHYRIGEEGFPEPDNTLKIANGTVGPTVDAALGEGGTHLVATAGLSFARQFELLNSDGDTLHELDLEFGYFLRAGITFKR